MGLLADVSKEFQDKGWELYERKRDGEEHPLRDIREKGPVTKLEENVSYSIWPRGFPFGDQEALDPLVKRKGNHLEIYLVMPDTPNPTGVAVCRFGGKGQDVYSFPLAPNERVDLIGFTPREETIQLLSPQETHVIPSVFRDSLDSLPDITPFLGS